MARIINTKKIDRLNDAPAIRDTMIEVADGIYLEEKVGTGSDYFANIPVNLPLSEVSLDQLLAESYIDAPGVWRSGGHVVVREGDQLRRYGAGEIWGVTLSPETVIVAIQPYLPRVPGNTEWGSLVQVGKPGFGTGRLTIGPQGYFIYSNMALFVEATGKYKGMFNPETISK